MLGLVGDFIFDRSSELAVVLLAVEVIWSQHR